MPLLFCSLDLSRRSAQASPGGIRAKGYGSLCALLEFSQHGCLNRVLRSVPAFHPGSAERIPRLSGHAREKQRHPPSKKGTSELGRNIYKGEHHEAVCIGRAAWELGHWHGGRGGEFVRLKREREGAEREPTTIRLLPAAAAADRHWTHEEANGAAGT